MKKYVFYSLVLLLSNFVFPRPDYTAKSLEYKGKIKSVTNFAYEPTEKFGELEKGTPKSKSIISFFEDGLVRSLLTTDENNQLVESVEISISKNIRTITEVKVREKNGRPEKIIYVEVLNNSNFVMIRTNVGKQGTEISNDQLQYNGLGKITSETKYNRSGQIISKTIYAYDEKGNAVSKSEYSSDGSLSEKWISTFEGSRMIKEVGYDENDRVKQIGTTSYDERGNRTEMVASLPAAMYKVTMKYKYDESNLKIWEATQVDFRGSGGGTTTKFERILDSTGNSTSAKGTTWAKVNFGFINGNPTLDGKSEIKLTESTYVYY